MVGRPAIAEKLAVEVDVDTQKKSHESLSNREFQVLCLIGSGKNVKEIAEELSLSIKTISTYREHILKKMVLKNNAEIMFYVIKHGLVEL